MYSYKTCLDYGLTGVLSRSVGLKRDLRLSKLETYSNYYFLNFRGFIGQHGDCYDRFLIRMCEMSESLNIIIQIIVKMTKFKSNFNKTTSNHSHTFLKFTNQQLKTDIKSQYSSMEYLIKHFKYWSEGCKIQPNWVYSSVESPKGEFGVSLIADGTNIPYRCKVRSPAYHNLHSLPQITRGHFLADLVALIGTIDVVFGEVDR